MRSPSHRIARSFWTLWYDIKNSSERLSACVALPPSHRWCIRRFRTDHATCSHLKRLHRQTMLSAMFAWCSKIPNAPHKRYYQFCSALVVDREFRQRILSVVVIILVGPVRCCPPAAGKRHFSTSLPNPGASSLSVRRSLKSIRSLSFWHEQFNVYTKILNIHRIYIEIYMKRIMRSGSDKCILYIHVYSFAHREQIRFQVL